MTQIVSRIWVGKIPSLDGIGSKTASTVHPSAGSSDRTGSVESNGGGSDWVPESDEPANRQPTKRYPSDGTASTDTGTPLKYVPVHGYGCAGSEMPARFPSMCSEFTRTSPSPAGSATVNSRTPASPKTSTASARRPSLRSSARSRQQGPHYTGHKQQAATKAHDAQHSKACRHNTAKRGIRQGIRSRKPSPS